MRPITLGVVVALASSLFVAHYDELATDKSRMTLNPDLDKYQALEDSGSLLILGLFCADELVGYSINVIHSSLHYRDLCICENDVLFVAKDHRSQQAGSELMGATEDAGRASGARMVLWHAKPGTALAMMLEHHEAYRVQDIVYSKGL